MRAKEAGSQPEAKTAESHKPQDYRGKQEGRGANASPQGHSPRDGSPESQAPYSSHHLLQLQRLYGNRSVQRLLQSAGRPASPHATKDDEASELVADPEAAGKTAGDGASPDDGASPGDGTSAGASAGGGDSPSADRGRTLGLALRARMQNAFGHRFEHVRIRTDSGAATAAARQRAHAITVGSEISFGSGEFAPYTKSGDRLLAHELTHVVQFDQGRMPAQGVLSPRHELEREAYASERRVSALLPSIDERLGATPNPGSGSAKYRGEPAVARAPDQPAANGPERHGPSTTEAALMGPLPTAEEAHAQIVGSAGPAPQLPGAAQSGPSPVPPAAPREERRPPVVNGAPTRQERDQAADRVLPPVEAAAAAGRASPPAATHGAVPTLGGPSEWTLTLARESSLRIEALRAAAATGIQRIRSRSEGSIAEARSAFDAARARFDSEAQTALAAIDASHGEETRRVADDMTALETDLDAHFATSSQAVQGTTDGARTRLTEVVEAEANRSRTESAARAAQAGGLAESGTAQGDPPLADGQREIASRVAGEMADQCQQTGEDAAGEVRKAGASHSAGIDGYLNQVLETLESARAAARAKLAQSLDETLASLAEQAAGASREVEARRSEATAALDQQEQAQYAWIRDQSEQQCVELSTSAEQHVQALTANFQSLSESIADAAAQAEPFFAAGATEDPAILAAQNVLNEEMSRAWATYVEPQLAQGDQIAASFDEHASGVEDGISRVLSDARAALEHTTDETVSGFTTLGERFRAFVGSAGDSVVAAVRQGVAASCAEADRAVGEHGREVTAETDRAAGAIQSAVDAQLTWEDQQVGRADEHIVAGQAEAATEYHSLEAQARAKDSSGARAAIARGWLGDLWDWFSDLAESTLEWFQEKLGRTWGNIIGHILRTLIYTAGVVAVAVAWTGAQVVNLVWGFIWGETAIPGYGGEVFAVIADIVAGVLVYGDIRDLFKYGIWRPFITGEGPWWLNLTLFVVTLIGLIPLFGDIFKGVVKIIKTGGKGTIKALIKLLGRDLAERILRRLGIEIVEEATERLAREVGQELAERMVRELGEEAAEALLEKLGKESLEKLARELSPTAINKLVGELGEKTLKRLAESLGGKAIETIATDLGREAIEKLLRTVTPEVVEELHRRLGKDAVLNLLKGLRGVTIKEYLDALGEDALKRLAKDLDGYAVKSLMDDVGERALKELAGQFDGAVVKRLADNLGAGVLKELTEGVGGAGVRELVEELTEKGLKDAIDALGVPLLKELYENVGVRGLKQLSEAVGWQGLKELSQEFGARGVKELLDDLGAESIKALLKEFGAAALKQLRDDLGRALLKEFVEEMSAKSLKKLVDRLGARTVKDLAEAIGVKEVRTLADKFGYDGLANLVAEIGVQGIKDVGVRALKKLPGILSPTDIKNWIADLGVAEFRRVAETYTGEALKHYGSAWFKAYKGVTAQTQHHLLVGEFNNLGHLRAGCHDKGVFDAVVAAGNAIIDATRTRSVGIYTEYWWRRPTQAVNNLGPKTVVDGLAADWVTWAERIRKATDELIGNRTFPINPGAIPETTMENASWRGFFRNDEIATFFPTI